MIEVPGSGPVVGAPALVETSFRRRYLAKLTTNVAGLAVNFVNISVLPRTLGPVAYGSFEFLSTFFQNMSAFWDMGTSTAFFTKLSRRNGDVGLLRFYFGYAALVAVAIAAGLTIVWVLGVAPMVWPQQHWRFILLAAGLGYFTWVSEVFRKVVDAFGLTVSGEFTVLGLRAAGGAAVLVLFACGWLNLTSLFVKEQALAAGVCVGLGWVAARHWRRRLAASATRTPHPVLRREFWLYCSPLVSYSVMSVGTSLADRWILQTFAGSKEQGFYGLASRVASVSLLFSVAMTQLLQREFSRAHGAADLGAMQHLFRRYIPFLFALTAYFAAYASVETRTLVALLGGAAFAPAVPATMLMTLYPIHQTYGQLSGSVFYATDQTALYRNLGVLSMAGGLIMTWLVLAPRQYGGFGAGSEGLAIKMLVVQFLSVNLQLWFNLKHLRMKFGSFLAHQFIVVGTFLALARASVAIVRLAGLSSLAEFGVAGVLYTLLIGLTCWRWPSVAGLSRADLHLVASKIRGGLTR